MHDAVQAMLPRIDYPELLLEVHARTGMFDFLDAMFNLDGPVRPEIVITDTGSPTLRAPR